MMWWVSGAAGLLAVAWGIAVLVAMHHEVRQVAIQS
jgi:hypothetical protein